MAHKYEALVKSLNQKTAGAANTGSLMDRILSDFTKGAARNPRLGNVQMGEHGQETKIASAKLTHLDVAKIAGVLTALDEAGFSLKEACEMTGHPEGVLREVLETVR